MGVRKGSLMLRPATIVNTGSRQLNIAPDTSIFPSFGSIGSIVRYLPAKETSIQRGQFQQRTARRDGRRNVITHLEQ